MLGLDQVTDDYYSQFLTSTVWLHICRVSRNDQDSPDLSRLTQNTLYPRIYIDCEIRVVMMASLSKE